MAKPDTDDGWIKMAHELDAALAFADFTKAQRIVLHYAFAQMFQKGVNHRVVSLEPAAIADGLGLDRSNACHAIAALVADGVLMKTARCRYAFSKNYEAWRKGDKPRFKPGEVQAIKAAPDRALWFRKCSNSLSDQTTPVVQPDNDSVVQRDNAVVQPNNETLFNQTTFRASPHTPLYGRKKEEVCVEGTHTLPIKASEPEPAAPAVDPRLKAIGDRIARLGAEPSVVYRLAEMGWAPDWIDAAVIKAIGTSKSVTGALSVGYLRAILKGFGTTGPTDDDRAKVADQRRAERPVEYYEGRRPRKAASE